MVKMKDMIERRHQMLAQAGPRWRQPSVAEVLSNVAFLRGIHPSIIDWLRRNSEMKVRGGADAAGRAAGARCMQLGGRAAVYPGARVPARRAQGS